ncbi:MAG: glycosyltransferase family 39 protein [Thermoprotei archaeon]|nr:glycosyltransferase family 39 protein [Thermoprotei archaeon]
MGLLEDRLQGWKLWIPLLASALYPLILIARMLASRALPWWSDGGNWLKHMNAILGNTYPMWEEGTYQYPPLSFFILAALYLLSGDRIFAIKAGLTLAFVLRPLTTYLLATELFESKVGGLAAAWFTSMAPLFVEVLGWGGYPNLLGFDLLPLAFLAILRSAKRRHGHKALFLMLFMSALMPFVHHLTFLVFICVLMLWFVFLLVLRKEDVKYVLLSFAVSISSFLAYRLLLAWPPQFVVFNEAAYYRLRAYPDLGWIFKNMKLVSIILITIFFAPFLMVKKSANVRSLVFLLAWLFAPLIMTYGYLLGIAIDYNRIFFFTFQPVLIMAATPMVDLDGVLSILSSVKEQGLIAFLKGLRYSSSKLLQLLALSLMILSFMGLVLINAVGYVTLRNVNYWYFFLDKYGDSEKLDAVKWIMENTGPRAIFVTEEPMARWIEGLAGRRVMMHLHPMYLFMTGELERERIARALLCSENGMLNGIIWVMDQAPSGSYAPLVAFYLQGAYEDTFYIDLSSSSLTWESGNVVHNLSLARHLNSWVRWLARSSSLGILEAGFNYGPFLLVRRISLYANDKTLQVDFTLRANQALLPLNLTIAISPARGTTFIEMYYGLGGRIALITNRGLLLIKCDKPIYDALTHQNKLLLVYRCEEPEYELTLKFCITSNWLRDKGESVFSYSSHELIRAHNISYVVIPQLPVNMFREGSARLRTISEYQHLLNNDKFTIAYINKRVIVLAPRVSTSSISHH